MTTPHDEAVDEQQAAKILGVSAATLRKMRCLGPQETGLPHVPFFKYSSRCVRYSTADLLAYRERYRTEADHE